MVLDEPTNDLDLETLDLLQEQLSDYAGTVLLVSHDRDFLDRLVTSVIAAEGGGRWVEYAGGYTDMLAQGGRPVGGHALPSAAPRPAAARPVSAPSPKARRMTFRHRHALQSLPARIAALEAEIEGLRARLADPDLYARDPARFAETTSALATAQDMLGAAEDQWLTLEALREELESG